MSLFGNTNSLFGAASTPAASTGGSTPSLFGAASSTANTGTPSLFGAKATVTSSTPATSTPLFGTGTSSLFGAKPAAAPASSAAPAASSAAPAPLFNLSAPTTSTTPSLFGTTATTSAPAAAAPATKSLFGTAAPTASSSSSTPSLFGTTPATSTTAAPALPKLGGTTSLFGTTPATPASSASSTGLKLGTTTAASTAPTFSLGAATTTTTAAATTTAYTYKQVEELINKWSIELEDQEQMFMRQANQVNQWDRLLMSNAEHITDLNSEVDKVRADQQRLNHDLDFISSQQQELEDMLQPLEEKIKSAGVSLNNQYSDNEREKTYSLAEHIDGQLQQMSGDITEVIEHLNSVNSSHQDENNPMYQISKILNMHMDALVWIDQHSTVLQKRVEDVSVLCDSRKREQENNFRMAFE